MPTPNLDADNLDVMIRPFDPEDKNILLKSWLMSYRDWYKGVTDQVYFDQQKRLIFTLARRSHVAIACDRTMPMYVLGFVAAQPIQRKETQADPLIVHYAWTRQNYRRLGLLKLMLQHLGWVQGKPIEATHWSYRAKDLQRSFSLTYNPYLIMDMARDKTKLGQPEVTA